MTRAFLFSASILVLAITGMILYLWNETRFIQSEILVPIQAPVPLSASAKPSNSPETTLRRLSGELNAHGIPLHDPDALDALPYEVLDEYMQAALDHPGEFFSAEFEASSLRVAATWIRKQKRFIFRRAAWMNCLRLRWTVPRINDLAEPCQRVAGRFGRKFPENGAARAYSQAHIEQPDKELVRLQRRYLRNPYAPGALEELSLALARGGDIEVARKLTGEMLQLDVERASRLEQELIRLEGFSYPEFQFDFE